VRQKIVLVIILLIAVAFCEETKNKNDITRLTDYTDSISYMLGRDVGSQLKKFGAEIHMKHFVSGMEQALSGTKSIIDSVRTDSIRQAFASKVQEKVTTDEQILAEKNKKVSEEFFVQNKKKPGVETSKSGLQYKVLEKGKGQKPTINDSVLVMYKGMFTDGNVFDSTVANKPVPLYLQRTIPGLAEGLQMMSVGAKYRFFVPPELGYGTQGAPPVIPPNSVLIFDITLSKIIGTK
jgi:FKBP-type peptidyl-prolyl cis-trans isomerase